MAVQILEKTTERIVIRRVVSPNITIRIFFQLSLLMLIGVGISALFYDVQDIFLLISPWLSIWGYLSLIALCVLSTSDKNVTLTIDQLNNSFIIQYRFSQQAYSLTRIKDIRAGEHTKIISTGLNGYTYPSVSVDLLLTKRRNPEKVFWRMTGVDEHNDKADVRTIVRLIQSFLTERSERDRVENQTIGG